MKILKQLDIIENNILDGQSFDESQNDNLDVIIIKKIDANKKIKIKMR